MIALGNRPRRRGVSLTPMIDVVFLLLVFFMLAARFGGDRAVSLTLGADAGGEWRGPPRLVVLTPEGTTLNGTAVAVAALPAALAPLLTRPVDPVIVRAAPGVPVQTALDTINALRGAGLNPVLVD